MNNYLNIDGDLIRLITSGKNWIEGEATRQLEAVSKFTGVIKVVGFPDLHPGSGYPVGAAIATKNIIYPLLIGNDIGCSISFWRTTLEANKIKVDKLAKKIDGFDDGSSQEGTIGSGNHFLEFHHIDDGNLDKGFLYFMIHSGSRNLGDTIYRKITSRCGKQGLEIGTDNFSEYMSDHDQAIEWAKNNHSIIANNIANILKCNVECISYTTHNSIVQYDDVFVHRKGASPTDQGVIVMPSSRGDFSYLVEAKDSCKDTLLSINHGAGRKIARANMSEDKVKATNQNYLKTKVICNDGDLMIEEHPSAYKKMDYILEAIDGFVNITAKLRPILTFKSSSEQG